MSVVRLCLGGGRSITRGVLAGAVAGLHIAGIASAGPTVRAHAQLRAG